VSPGADPLGAEQREKRAVFAVEHDGADGEAAFGDVEGEMLGHLPLVQHPSGLQVDLARVLDRTAATWTAICPGRPRWP
jgi:hypothetical protein